jgi:hypothetical protein
MKIECNKNYKIKMEISEEEYQKLNSELEFIYKKVVVDSQGTSNISTLWEFKDLLTAAVKG